MGAQSAVSSTLVFWLLALGWGVLAVVCGAGEAMCTVCASRSQAELSGGCNMQPQSNSTRGGAVWPAVLPAPGASSCPAPQHARVSATCGGRAGSVPVLAYHKHNQVLTATCKAATHLPCVSQASSLKRSTFKLQALSRDVSETESPLRSYGSWRAGSVVARWFSRWFGYLPAPEGRKGNVCRGG